MTTEPNDTTATNLVARTVPSPDPFALPRKNYDVIVIGAGHPVVVMPGWCPKMVMSIDDRGADKLAHVLLRDFAAGITLNRGGSFQFSISKRTTL